jgi:hypothetical protein
MNFEHEHAAQVSANSSSCKDYVPADGEKLYVKKMGGCACYNSDVHTKIVWDKDGTPEILFVTHGSIEREEPGHELAGDGTKKLSICLVNDSSQSETISAWLIGEKYV